MTSTGTNGTRRLDRALVGKGAVGFALFVLALAPTLALAGYNVEIVQGSERDIVAGTSLEYNGSGNPTIAYGDRTAGEVRLATKSGSGWNRETVDFRIPQTYTLDHAIDTNGNILVCYKVYNSPGYTLYAAQRIGGAWSVSTVAKGVSGSAISCAYDSSHVASVAHTFNGRLYLAKKSGSKWSSEVVAQGDLIEPSLVFDAAGKPAIAFVDNRSSETGIVYIKLARKPGSRWSIEPASEWPDMMRVPSLVFHPGSGEPMISHYASRSSAPGEIRLATKSGGLWTTEPVTGGYGNTLRIDSAGLLHIGLRDSSTNTQVFVASREPLVWSMELVDMSLNETAYSTPSTALDAAGIPALSYTYRTDVNANGDLRFASQASGP